MAARMEDAVYLYALDLMRTGRSLDNAANAAFARKTSAMDRQTWRVPSTDSKTPTP